MGGLPSQGPASLLGHNVTVQLGHNVIAQGILLSYSQMGEVSVLDQAGDVVYCWPALHIEATEDPAQSDDGTLNRLLTNRSADPKLHPIKAIVRDPDVIRGIERVTGEHYDQATGQWQRDQERSKDPTQSDDRMMIDCSPIEAPGTGPHITAKPPVYRPPPTDRPPCSH